MVQGCDISIMDVKSSVSKSVKVAAPTEEQKRLAQLSHIERIDTLENDIIKRMVEITKHSYEECAMELAGTNMDMESAINNLIEGNSEEWETMSKKVRPEKKPVVPVSETGDTTKTKRSSSKSERGRSTKSEETRDADRSRSSATRGGSNATRPASSASRGGSAVRGASGGRGGAATSRGRGGKRQLPPRMDSNRQREDSSKPRFESEARRSDTSTRTGGRGGGRSNGSYRHNYRGAKRPSEHESHEWGSANGVADTEESTNYSAEWTEDLGGSGWSRESGDKTTGWNSENTSGWGASEDTSTTSWVGGESDAPSAASATTATSQPPSSADNAWPAEQEEQSADTISEVNQWANSADDSTPAPTNTAHFDTSSAATSKPASQFDVGAHKRPAYTQAFSNSLSSILTSTEFAQSTSSSSFGFGFSQTPSSVSSDYNSRHEQAPGSTSLLKIQEALNSNSNNNSNNNAVTSARKISVEQLFQMHEKSTPDNATPTSIPEENGPSSPPTSSTSSNQSGRRSKRAQRTIPTEPVEMPGSAVESLDVQFGSIGFMDTSEEDASLPGEKTPANKMDAATSTTPHSAVETEPAGLVPGIQPISESDRLLHTSGVPTTVPQHSPQQSAFQSPHPAIHPVPHSLQSHSLHQTSTASLHQGVSSLQATAAASHHSSHGMASGHQTGVHQSPSGATHASGATPLSAQHTMQSAASHQPTAAHSTVTTQSGGSLHGMSQTSSLGQQSLQQPAPPPNLPPPNMDNIRNANNLITNRSMPEEVPQFGIKKSLPPGVYPTANLRSSANSLYYGEGSSVSSIPPPQQHNQSSGGYDARYYNTNSANSYDHSHHSHHRPLQQLAESTFSSQGVVQDKQQHYPSSGHRSTSDVQQQQLSSASHQPPHVGAGITSGISTTAAAPTGLGGGYPGPVLGYHYPIHPYPNNLYAAAAANYYHPFNPAALSYPQTQKPSVASYPATNSFGSSADSSSAAGSQFGGYETPEYKEMQYAATNKQGGGAAGGGGGGGMSHLPPVTTSNEYSKMMGADKNMFNMQYMQFPNYIQQIQQGQGQAAALIQQQGGLQQQRGVEQQRNPGAPIPHSHKHYWSHR